MLFDSFKCPICKLNRFLPDFDLTIDEYIKTDYNNDHMLVVIAYSPPSRPNYLIFKCSSTECGYTEKYTEEVILQKIIESWSNIAWLHSQAEVKKASNVGEYYTKHLIEGQRYKDISQQDLKNNVLLRRYVKNIEDEETKHTKKRNP